MLRKPILQVLLVDRTGFIVVVAGTTIAVQTPFPFGDSTLRLPAAPLEASAWLGYHHWINLCSPIAFQSHWLMYDAKPNYALLYNPCISNTAYLTIIGIDQLRNELPDYTITLKEIHL